MRFLGPTASLGLQVTLLLLVRAPEALAQGSGLVAAYGFNEGSGASVTDASGRGNTGTISGATRTASGRHGGGLSFDGVNDSVSIPDAASLDLSTGMTCEAWVYPTALSGYRTVVLKEIPGELAYGLYAHDGAPRPSAYINTGGATDPTAAGSAALPLNAWSHLAATYDGASLKLYVNGGVVGQRATSGGMVASSNPLKVGGNAVWGEWFRGLIDEVRIYDRALSPAEILADMNTPVGGTPPADTQPPAVSLTSPGSGAVLSNTVTVSAAATDDVGVVGVQFLLDGAVLGAEDFVTPYSTSWDTRTAANGPHSLSAVARDLAGQQTTAAAVAVSVTNGSDPSLIGSWAAPVELGMVAVNMVLLHTGKVLMYRGEDAGGASATVWDPVTGVRTSVPNDFTNIFCSGHSALADGRILVAGGHDTENGILGAADANIFDPATQQWTSVPAMTYRRWYPSCTTLGDGRVLVLSGAQSCFTCIASIPEIYNPLTNSWTRLTSANLAVPYYPFSFLLSDGRILDAGSGEQPMATYILNLSTGTWSTVDARVLDGGSAAMYRPDKVIKMGTAATTDVSNVPSERTTHVLDMTGPAPAWRQVASMAFPRAYHVSTLLPDGDVLVTCGGRTTEGKNIANAVYEAELWSPATETWRTLARMATPRLYHATALLLPDGRVAVAGSGDSFGGPDQTTAEFYSPPYLFKGPRPVIASVPSLLAYGGTFTLDTPDATAITSVALLRPGAVTHQFDEDQRYLPLAFTSGPGLLNVQAPASPNLAPPGYYLVFILNGAGVPSVGRFTRLPSPAEDVTPPGPPSNLAATGSLGRADLSWSPASDPNGVAGYNVHRSTADGFTPAPANRIAQATGTSHADLGLAAGTYYYRVTAQDVAGNISAPSNQASAVVIADTAAPTVAITSPVDGATVTGAVTVTAQADDAVGVAGVQFKLDGTNLGAEDPSAPFSVAWNSATALNGIHSLTAVARDAAGNQTESAAVAVAVSNTQSPPSGLVAAYGFSEGSGPTAADGSGRGNVGTLAGAAWTASGRFGNALSFDGLNDMVSIPDSASLDLTTGMTLEAWVYPTALSGYRTVVLKEVPGGLAYALYAHDEAPRPAVYVRIGGADPTAPGTSALPLNTWTHLAATYDGSSLRLYVNGAQVGQRATSGGIAGSANLLRLGGNAVWGEWFAGRIDEVRIYNRALAVAELESDMTAPVDGAVAPRLVINSPAEGATLNGSTVSIAYSAAGDLTGVDHVHFQLDGGPEVMDPPPLDGVFQLNGVSPGAHVLGGFLVRANHAKIVDTDAIPVHFTLVDAAPPVVALTAPGAGATVSGSVTVSAEASSANGIAGVQFLIDGAPLAAEDVASPYALVWDTTAAANGTHVLSARARDGGGITATSAGVTVTVANAPPPPSGGLVAAYGFNEGSGGSVTDASGRGNTGTISGATRTASGRHGGGLSFDGVNDSVSIPDAASLDLTTGMTCEAWVYPTALSGYRTVVLKEIPGELAYGLYAHDGAPRPSAYINTGGATDPTAAGSAALPLNAWSHLAATYDGASLKLYVNGGVVGQRATSGAMVASSNPLKVGGNAVWGEWFRGLIDEVRIYDRALSPAEILADMNTPVGN